MFYLLLMKLVLSCLFQKREGGNGTVTSPSDKSSGIKSVSIPSTPQAESVNLNAESRLSNSLLTDSTPSVDHLSEARHDREVPEDNYLGGETPLVCSQQPYNIVSLSFTLQ